MTRRIGSRSYREYIVSPVTSEDLESLRTRTLVPHGRKCLDCGSTLVEDPLPHYCDPMTGPRCVDYGDCLL